MTAEFEAVLAFDLGRTLGVAVSRAGGMKADTIRLHGERADVFGQLSRYAASKIGSAEPEIVVYERPFARGLAATRMLWGMAAIIERAAYFYRLPCLDILPAILKKHATESGAASKATMLLAAQTMGWPATNDHEADACWLAHMVATKAEIGDAA